MHFNVHYGWNEKRSVHFCSMFVVKDTCCTYNILVEKNGDV